MDVIPSASEGSSRQSSWSLWHYATQTAQSAQTTQKTARAICSFRFCVICAFSALCVPPVRVAGTPAGYDDLTEGPSLTLGMTRTAEYLTLLTNWPTLLPSR